MKLIEMRKNSFVRFGCEPMGSFAAEKVLTETIVARDEHAADRYFVEISLPMHVSSYALAGYVFEPADCDALKIEVSVKEDRQVFQDSLGWQKELIYAGLNEEYAEIVLEAVKKYFLGRIAPKGKLRICMGAYSSVSSGRLIFGIAVNILLDIFMERKLDEEKIRNIVQQRMEQRF